eukprot:4914261-Prymnesium_polylepis.2
MCKATFEVRRGVRATCLRERDVALWAVRGRGPQGRETRDTLACVCLQVVLAEQDKRLIDDDDD